MIKIESDGPLTTFTLQHGKVNALDIELLDELLDLLDSFEQSPATGAILTGAGPTFSAGVDLFRIIKEGKPYIDRFLPQLTKVLLRLFTLSKPVVAAVNGHAIAGGALLALACDYKIMASGGGRIGIPELLVGVPFPSLPLEIARFALPTATFQKLIYFGLTPNSEEALSLGILNETTAPEHLPARAREVLISLTKLPPDSFAATKRLMRQPALDNHEKYKTTLDPDAAEIWASGKTLENLQAYLDRTVSRKR